MIDQKTFRELCQMVGDDFIHELLESYFESGPQLLDELRKALSAGDADAFRRAAHSLKSNSASFGAMDLAAQARELEALGRDGQLDQVGDKIDRTEASYTQVVEELKRAAG